MKSLILLITILSCQYLFASTVKPATFDHIVVIILENTNADEAAQQPFISQLIRSGAYLTNYHAVAHPSQPNYIALIAGDTLGFTSDFTSTVDSTNLADLLEAKNKSWKSYAENYPGNCYQSSDSPDGKYVRKHEPFISFKSIQDDVQRCNSHIVDASVLSDDLQNGNLPNFSLFIPNIDNDGHDTDISYADNWLSQNFGPLMKDNRFMNRTLLIVTFDENDQWDDTDNNRIATVLYGQGVRSGSTSDVEYTHYSLLRLIEDNFQLGSLNRNDVSATPIEGIWQ